jgi:hypothetical protein
MLVPLKADLMMDLVVVVEEEEAEVVEVGDFAELVGVVEGNLEREEMVREEEEVVVVVEVAEVMAIRKSGYLLPS